MNTVMRVFVLLLALVGVMWGISCWGYDQQLADPAIKEAAPAARYVGSEVAMPQSGEFRPLDHYAVLNREIPTKAVRILVRDEEGKAVPGVEIGTLNGPITERCMAASVIRWMGVSDAQGAIEVNADAVAPEWVVGKASSHVVAPARWSPLVGDIVLRATRSGSAHVQVRMVDGSLPRGATVTVSRQPTSSLNAREEWIGGLMLDSPSAAAWASCVQGEAVFPALFPGIHHVEARLDGCVEVFDARSLLMTIRAGEATTLDVTLAPLVGVAVELDAEILYHTWTYTSMPAVIGRTLSTYSRHADEIRRRYPQSIVAVFAPPAGAGEPVVRLDYYCRQGGWGSATLSASRLERLVPTRISAGGGGDRTGEVQLLLTGVDCDAGLMPHLIAVRRGEPRFAKVVSPSGLRVPDGEYILMSPDEVTAKCLQLPLQFNVVAGQRSMVEVVSKFPCRPVRMSVEDSCGMPVTGYTMRVETPALGDPVVASGFFDSAGSITLVLESEVQSYFLESDGYRPLQVRLGSASATSGGVISSIGTMKFILEPSN